MTSASEAKRILAQDPKVAKVTPVVLMTPARKAKVDFVKAHAAAYPDAGWDVVLETADDQEIAAAIGSARTMTGAVNAVREALVEPWVRNLIESRPGEDDDEQLVIGARFEEERKANWYDATARTRGEVNEIAPPRKHAVRVLPQMVTIDLTKYTEPTEDEKAAMKAPRKPRVSKAASGEGGRQSPSTRTTRTRTTTGQKAAAPAAKQPATRKRAASSTTK